MNSVVIRVIVTVVVVAVGVFGGTPAAAQVSSSRAAYVARARSGTQGEVRVSAAALSANESAAVYGSPLADKLIQPVWIEVENNEDVPYWLMFAGLDPNFFPASEAAEAMAAGGSNRKLEELDRRFSELAFRNPVPPGATVSGFVLTNLNEGVKLLQIDSQVIYSDQIIPGSTLLGFLNCDHWAIAVPVNRSHPVISRSLVDKNDYPREGMLEAVLRFIEEDLAGPP
jgi:hypothetical protein